MKHPFTKDIKGYKHLIPTNALLKRAETHLRKYYKDELKKGNHHKLLYLRYSTIRKGAVIFYEFLLYTKRRGSKSVFEISEIYDFKRKKGFMSEKKQLTFIAGWQYKPNFHYYIYSFTQKKNSLNSFKQPNIHLKSSSFKNIKFHEHFSIPARRLSGYVYLNDWQKLLDKDPYKMEALYKLGYIAIMRNVIGKDFLEFLIKYHKQIKYKNNLRVLRNYFKLWKAYDKPQSLNNITKILNNDKIDIYITPQTILKRVINLNMSHYELTKFKKACQALDLNYLKEINKGKSVREAIITEHKLEKARKEREYAERWAARSRDRVVEINEQTKKDKNYKQTAKSLEEVTKEFKHVKVDNLKFKPIKTMKEFMEISEELNLCLVQNKYFDQVRKGDKAIYIVQPEGTDIKEAEVVEFYLKDFKVGQVNGLSNTHTMLHDKIKKIAKSFTKGDVLNVSTT